MATCSTLDLLDADDGTVDETHGYDVGERAFVDVADNEDRELRRMGLRRPSSARELFLIQGEPTGTSRSRTVVSKKPRPASATSTRPRHHGGNQSQTEDGSGDGGPALSAKRSKQDKHEVLQAEIRALHEQLEQTQRELAHTREEREELQVAFRRLDQEITNGYNLTERKEKEMKITELLTKNQKLSHMLEKELKNQQTLQAANADLQSQVQGLGSQTTLLRQLLTSIESKHAALVEVHSQLTANHSIAQQHVADLQAQVLGWEAKRIESARGHGVDYEEKLRLWESKCIELQRKLNGKNTMLRAEQEKCMVLERTCEKLLEEKASMESEVASVHDKMIRMNGAMKTMEATVEASSTSSTGSLLANRMKERVRVLEEDILEKNRLVVDLKETVNGLLNGQSVGRAHKGLKRRLSGTSSGDARIDASRMIALTQRARKAEEARDHKSRCLNVLLAVFPQLLQQLDALQDKCHATIESNTILSHAIEQLQSGSQDVQVLQGESVVALAREGYLVSAPYHPELLMGFTISRALTEIAPPPLKKRAKFMPFHVRARTNIAENSSSQGELLLAADCDDASGVSFLNRSKINAFLHFVQGSATKAKCKSLLVQKIADLLSAQRDLMQNHSTESGYYKASIAKFDAEVNQRAKQLAQVQNEVGRFRHNAEHSEGKSSRRIRLLLKLVDATAHMSHTRQTTFLTQADSSCASDILIAGDHATTTAPITMDLSGCDICDEDLEPLLLKISVSGALVSELDLSDNEISDDGAAIIAAFLETCPPKLKVLNLRGNSMITSEGVNRLKSGLLKNSRTCRIEVDSARHSMAAIAIDSEYDTAGRPSVILQVYQ